MTTATNGETWLTVDEVAVRVSLHPDTVRRLLREGRITGHRISRRAGWRVRPADLDRFIIGDTGEARDAEEERR